MEAMEAIAKRRSVRSYQADRIPEEDLKAILLAGCAAPVGMRKYDTLHITVIQDQQILKRMSEMIKNQMKTEHDPLYHVPTVIVVFSKEPPMPGIDYVNAACVMENMMIAAADRGIGSVILWGTALAVEADQSVKAALKVPDGYKAIVGAGFGYAAGGSAERTMEMTINTNFI